MPTIWIINPFDYLPGESDVPLRYWTLARTLAEAGHAVTWVSSSFSHRFKKERTGITHTEPFAIHLIPTPPYARNISFARLRNHRAFARGFLAWARTQTPPDHIVASLPPLGSPLAALDYRDETVRRSDSQTVRRLDGESVRQSDGPTVRPIRQAQGLRQSDGEAVRPIRQAQGLRRSTGPAVTVDIMDAWPEVFHQVIPRPLRRVLGPVLFAPWHRQAREIFRRADKVSAVSEAYLWMADDPTSLKLRGAGGGRMTDGGETVRRSDGPTHSAGSLRHRSGPSAGSATVQQSDSPTVRRSDSPTVRPVRQAPFDIAQGLRQGLRRSDRYLCYHGADYKRFAEGGGQRTEGGGRSDGPTVRQSDGSTVRQSDGSTVRQSDGSTVRQSDGPNVPRNAVYIGALERGYDLDTLIDLARRWRAEGRFPWVLHFAGAGSAEARLREKAGPLEAEGRVVFHGHLSAEGVAGLLAQAQVGLVPNRPETLVACPYKLAEYAASGLPVISALRGELEKLLDGHAAFYTAGDTASLEAAFTAAEALAAVPRVAYLQEHFDRAKTYPAWAEWILGKDEG